MTSFARSGDGTRIAYDRIGRGLDLILFSGLDTAIRIAELLPDGAHAVLEGHDHDAPPKVVAPVVAEFLSRVRAA